jgi:DNA-binding transcriptional ArsR family regulator
MGAKRAVAMKARATKQSVEVARERQTRPRPERLDRVVHDRMRLAILAALAGNETLSFTDLKTITGTTDGNLSVHARRLEDAGYVLCEKTFAGRTPRTE